MLYLNNSWKADHVEKVDRDEYNKIRTSYLQNSFIVVMGGI